MSSKQSIFAVIIMYTECENEKAKLILIIPLKAHASFSDGSQNSIECMFRLLLMCFHDRQCMKTNMITTTTKHGCFMLILFSLYIWGVLPYLIIASPEPYRHVNFLLGSVAMHLYSRYHLWMWHRATVAFFHLKKSYWKIHLRKTSSTNTTKFVLTAIFRNNVRIVFHPLAVGCSVCLIQSPRLNTFSSLTINCLISSKIHRCIAFCTNDNPKKYYYTLVWEYWEQETQLKMENGS